MRLKINKLKQKGDTIVEVLIAIAIISLILSLSYGLANRSSQATRMAQERSEALKIGEDQVESLKAYLEDNKDTGIPGGGFCVVQSGGNFSIVPSSSSSCQKGPQDTPGVGRYRINITKDGDLYRINLEWDTVSGGTVDDTLTLTYRLSPTDIDYVDEPPEPEIPEANINVVVRKIPPAAGNTTPSCSSSATQNKGGSTVTLNPGNQLGSTAMSDSSVSFSGLEENTRYTAHVSAPSGHSVCSPSSQGVTTGGPNSTKTLTFKIRPICSITDYNNYWSYGNRRVDLDDWYIHNYNYHNPTYGFNWNSHFAAGNVKTSGNFFYVYSGSNAWWNPTASWYWIYEAHWHSDPIRTCPS